MARSVRRTFLLPTIGVVLLVGISFSFAAYFYAERTIASQLEARVAQLNQKVAGDLDAIFTKAEEILHQNAKLFALDSTERADASKIRDILLAEVTSFHVPTSIYFGNPDGGIVVAGHEGKHENFYEILTDDFKAGSFTKRNISKDGVQGDVLLTLPNYDARTRPWYIRAIQHEGQVTWGDVYVLFTGHDLAVAPSIAVRGADNKTLGVAGMDIFVSPISNKLVSDQPIDGMVTFLIEQKSGYLIAASDKSVVFESTGEPKAFKRIRGVESGNDLISEASRWLGGLDPARLSEEAGVAARRGVLGKDFALAAKALGTLNRPDWMVVSVIPASAISATLEERLFLFITLIFVSCLLTAGTVAYFAGRISK